MLDVAQIRSEYPALAREVKGVPVAYLDGPGGTQVPQSVIDAMGGALAAGISNLGGPFAASELSVAITADARRAVADLFNAPSPDSIVFGQNMTSLVMALSRALARTWQPGEVLVVTRLDHDANISPWLLAAADRGLEVRWVDFDPQSGRLDFDSLDRALTGDVRLVAVTHASNAIGTVVDAAEVCERARAAGALSVVDAVHFGPHGLIDVQEVGCDFLAASAYKFFGPHTGTMYGRPELLAAIEPYRVRPAPSEPPGSWETGTQSFESLAGVVAAVDHIAGLSGTSSGARRTRIVAAHEQIAVHQAAVTERFLAGLSEMGHVRLFGPSDGPRTPTFAVSVEGRSPAEVAREMGRNGIFVWHGHYYALAVMEHLGVLEEGGLVRIGFVHYNTEAEVDRVLAALDEMG